MEATIASIRKSENETIQKLANQTKGHEIELSLKLKEKETLQTRLSELESKLLQLKEQNEERLNTTMKVSADLQRDWYVFSSSEHY